MNRRRLLQTLLASAAWLPALDVFAGPRLLGARSEATAGGLRLVLDLDGPFHYRTFTLSAPERLVVDLDGASLGTPLASPAPSGPLRGLRSGRLADGGTRLVLDLAEPVQLQAFALGPQAGRGHRLVLDLHPAGAPVPVATAKPAGKGRDILVVVDAGHGGKDPGALGSRGEREKDVALLIAQNLARRIDRQNGFKARLVRNVDVFIPLRQRVEVARRCNADMFVSVHADAAPRRTASGASVFALSEHGATSTLARFMAERENGADLIGATGNLPLQDKDPALAKVILDMSLSSTIASSLDLGHSVLRSLGGITRLHQERVDQAGFAVLKSPDIPSILVETGFISNDADCRRLHDARHQQELAGAIFDGLHGYFRQRPPVGSLLAALREQGKA
ncbi:MULTISPECIES: N-acetylmuramoyl-L-alanine amidase [unclassified Pseudomonas]|uniref:N-acetylmuramoyl-L-alanine amidase n=1 Tax=unclassified Pseudomonas TaxID=196821 RepID=UPI000730164C|nr:MULTISPECIES: N-acetylmuramoyl-L-alanine amidase [unclassified Pseudomonas]KSW24958.1 N-acetylmuramoyl-L-alanine amidase [Pseudomonas sp. ADP]OBP08345.1 N-acetylmuramoyl-L-alanine amidase [Pseudomonas sp. EGD-AKN5]QOF87522.1 N-acetylmuramoyl-L-alanine amidase [Pseudomonas sp. ADPe]